MIKGIDMKNGKLPESVLKRSVLKRIGKGAGVGADCAFFCIPDGQILAWCAQEAVLALRADAGAVARLVQKAANNLAAAGAKPVSAQITLLLPLASEEALVKDIMSEAAEKCKELGMEIDGGDTNVASAVTLPVMTVVAMGVVAPDERHDITMARAGQDIVMSKWVGLEGTAILAGNYEEKLLERYPAYLVEEAQEFERYLSVLPEAEVAMREGVFAMHDMSQGGVFGALWELAEGAGLGLEVDLKRIPIRQETVEVCEVCGVNPYEMRSAGSLLMTAADGESLVRALEQAGISATVLGKLTDAPDRVLINGEEKRFLYRPVGTDAIAELAAEG